MPTNGGLSEIHLLEQYERPRMENRRLENKENQFGKNNLITPPPSVNMCGTTKKIGLT